MKITAAVVEEKGGPFVLKDDIELAEMGPTDLQVRIVATGICHSDEAIRKGDASLGYPVILGHEGSGIVEKLAHKSVIFQLVIMLYYLFTQMELVITVCVEFRPNAVVTLNAI